MLVRGSCHCGNIGFALDWRPDPEDIPARACSCSFCRKHGGVWTACPEGALTVRIKDPAKVSAYRFGTKTADFHVCASCGAVPVVSSRIDGRLHAVVSVLAFDDVDPARLRQVPVSYDGEDEASRLARRATHWIPNVEFVQGGM
ncbi:aldehyde-activating protein [[Pseudomonas] boreopolis]|jgi:hypothetical protein|uniref:Aldehyde-activating protein n=2 Tax=Xanthomonas boreopolis TaxID=86183 RepID=A0A919FAT2_9XANT|nr:aldehyde-activating protein [[Pseudomonas] boreopolis]